MNYFEKFDQPVTKILELYRPKVAGVGLLNVAHSGVGFVFANGEQLVLHRTPDNNTHVSSREEFACGFDCVVREVKNCSIPETTSRAKKLLALDSKYSVFDNCEHLKNFVLKGDATSEQLKALGVGTGVGGLLAVTLLKDLSTPVKITSVAVIGLLFMGAKRQELLSR